EVCLLNESHPETPQHRIKGHAGARDSTPQNKEIERLSSERVNGPLHEASPLNNCAHSATHPPDPLVRGVGSVLGLVCYSKGYSIAQAPEPDQPQKMAGKW